MDFIQIERKNDIALLTIDRPEALNALNRAVLEALSEALEQLAETPIRALIITGAGDRAFVAGADVAEMATFTPEEAAAFGRFGNDVMTRVARFPAPVIAAVHGYALGGGFELALAADIAIASDLARFAFPETGLGITPGFGGTQRLARRIGPMAASELIYTGRRIKADEAKALGIVLDVVDADDLMDRAWTLAEAVANNAPIAVRRAKRALNEGLDGTLDEGIALEVEQFGACFSTEDQTNAMRAFVNKEKAPPFKGR